MITKPEKSKRKFIPITIAESLKTVNRKFLYKFGKLDYTIHAKWSDIVGSFFINHSEPLKITSILSSVDENPHTSNAFLAAFTALSISSALPKDITAQFSSVDGSMTLISSEFFGLTHCPSI